MNREDPMPRDYFLDDYDLGPQSDEGFEDDDYGEPEEDEEIDESEADAEFGRVCVGCGRPFTEEHGYPALCTSCQVSKPSLLVGDVQPATHPLSI